MYSDLTGIYPIILSRGNQYIVICYYYDTNSMQAITTKNRNAAEIRDAKMSILTTLTTMGINLISTYLTMSNHPV